jgi:5-methylcytosine-specific restriction endonuclease McrA
MKKGYKDNIEKLTNENISVDHIIPKSKGGSNKKENIRLVHKDANLAKRALSDAEFLGLCRQVIAWSKKPATLSGDGPTMTN